jgi:hypothetical protein
MAAMARSAHPELLVVTVRLVAQVKAVSMLRRISE